MTERLRNRVERDFPHPGNADEVSQLVVSTSDSERVQAAVILAASGRLDDLRAAIALAQVDWRDLLVNVGLGNEDWLARLDVLLGPTAT